MNAGINILTDLMILAIPMPLVWSMRASVWHRLSLVFTFSLGSFVVFASIYRFYVVKEYIATDGSCTTPLNPPPPRVPNGEERGV